MRCLWVLCGWGRFLKIDKLGLVVKIYSMKELDFTILPAGVEEYEIIQNMSRFYFYDMSRSCGFTSEGWAFPADGLYGGLDAGHRRRYFENAVVPPLIIRVGGELAGFVLIGKDGVLAGSEWEIGEFCILGKFQSKGLGKRVAGEIFRTYAGQWELQIIPENLPALNFWRKTVGEYSDNNFCEVIRENKNGAKRIFISFDSEV